MMLHNAIVMTTIKGSSNLKAGQSLHQKPRHVYVKLCDGPASIVQIMVLWDHGIYSVKSEMIIRLDSYSKHI